MIERKIKGEKIRKAAYQEKRSIENDEEKEKTRRKKRKFNNKNKKENHYQKSCFGYVDFNKSKGEKKRATRKKNIQKFQ